MHTMWRAGRGSGVGSSDNKTDGMEGGQEKCLICAVIGLCASYALGKTQKVDACHTIESLGESSGPITERHVLRGELGSND